MNEYEISDYSIFEGAVATNKSLLTELDSFINTCNECKGTLGDLSVMEGPIAEGIQDMFTTIYNDVNTIIENITKLNNYIVKTDDSYQEADKAASNIVNGTESSESSKTMTVTAQDEATKKAIENIIKNTTK